MSLLTEEIRALIGSEARYTAPEEIGRAAIRYFALACGDNNPLYRDEAFARAHGHNSVIAPPTYICESNQYLDGQPDEDGYLGHRWNIPVTGCRALRGGHEYEFHRPLRPDDRVTVVWRITDMVERTGSNGRTMLIVSSEQHITDQRGEAHATNRETMIYQRVDEGE